MVWSTKSANTSNTFVKTQYVSIIEKTQTFSARLHLSMPSTGGRHPDDSVGHKPPTRSNPSQRRNLYRSARLHGESHEIPRPKNKPFNVKDPPRISRKRSTKKKESSNDDQEGKSTETTQTTERTKKAETTMDPKTTETTMDPTENIMDTGSIPTRDTETMGPTETTMDPKTTETTMDPTENIMDTGSIPTRDTETMGPTETTMDPKTTEMTMDPPKPKKGTTKKGVSSKKKKKVRSPKLPKRKRIGKSVASRPHSEEDDDLSGSVYSDHPENYNPDSDDLSDSITTKHLKSESKKAARKSVRQQKGKTVQHQPARDTKSVLAPDRASVNSGGRKSSSKGSESKARKPIPDTADVIDLTVEVKIEPSDEIDQLFMSPPPANASARELVAYQAAQVSAEYRAISAKALDSRRHDINLGFDMNLLLHNKNEQQSTVRQALNEPTSDKTPHDGSGVDDPVETGIDNGSGGEDVPVEADNDDGSGGEDVPVETGIDDGSGGEDPVESSNEDGSGDEDSVESSNEDGSGDGDSFEAGNDDGSRDGDSVKSDIVSNAKAKRPSQSSDESTDRSLSNYSGIEQDGSSSEEGDGNKQQKKGNQKPTQNKFHQRRHVLEGHQVPSRENHNGQLMFPMNPDAANMDILFSAQKKMKKSISFCEVLVRRS